MVSIPPGSFRMGAAEGEEERSGVPAYARGRSAPLHPVTLAHGFAMGKYDVTRAEFATFVAESGYAMGDTCHIYHDSTDGWDWNEYSGYSWRNPGFAQSDRDPAVCVSWDDARAYAAWLSRRTGHAYRLPTEAEWEYAARAGSAAARPWSDGEALCVHANVADPGLAGALGGRPSAKPLELLNCSDGHAFTSPAGAYPPNVLGLHDMLGNVWQSVEDCWTANYAGAPADGSPARAAGACDEHTVRGGSWFSAGWDVRVAMRGKFKSDYRTSKLGFRVVRDAR